MWRRLHEGLFLLLLRVPVVGDVLAIVNGYAYEGRHEALIRFAPLKYWVRRIGPKLFASGVLSVWITSRLTERFSMLPSSSAKLAEMVVGIFPNLLGFGIGVYALIFALPDSFLSSLRRPSGGTVRHATEESSSGVGSKIPSNMINADMAYPLIVMVCAIAYCAFAQVCMTIWRYYVSIWLLLYCFVLIIELINLIYMSAYKSISDRG